MRQSIRSDAKPVAAAFGQVVLFWLASMAVLIGAGAVVRHLAMRPEALAIGACASLATWLLSLVFLRWSGGSAASVGLEPDRRTPLRFTIGLAGGFVLVAAHMLLVVLFGFGHVHWVPAPTPATPALVATTAAGYLLLATREELAFRGYPLRRLEVVSGAWTAQGVLAGLFAIEHWLGGSGWHIALLGASLGALVFGAAALASRGLALPLGLHAAWNIGDWARGGKGGGGLWVAQVDAGQAEAAHRSGLIAYVLTMGAALVLLECLRRARAGRSDGDDA